MKEHSNINETRIFGCVPTATSCRQEILSDIHHMCAMNGKKNCALILVQ